MRGKKFGICHFFPHQAWEMTKGENEGKTLKNNLYKNFRKSWGKKMIFQKRGGGKNMEILENIYPCILGGAKINVGFIMII